MIPQYSGVTPSNLHVLITEAELLKKLKRPLQIFVFINTPILKEYHVGTYKLLCII